jgi:hypothetical protein
MPDAIPTPFDITAIPHIPWQPGRLEWMFLMAALALLALAAYYRNRPPAQPMRVTIVDLLLKDIELAAKMHSPDDIQRLSHLVRRVIEYLSNVEISSMSPGELESLSRSATPPSLSESLRCLAELEASVYAPPGEHQESGTYAATLVRALTEYVDVTRRR